MATARSKQSLWLLNAGVQQNAAVRTYPTLQSLTGAHYDAVVVGGGIFGCTTAYLLKESGKRVALIEARTIGSGVTGYSTAKLTAQQGIVYSKLVKKHNKKVARAYYDMNYNAVVAIEDLITRLNIDCEFSRRAHTTWTCVEESVKKVKDEYDTCMELGIECKLLKTDELVKELPASIRPLAGVRFENQAQFNPYKFCVELCKHINGGGSGVFEESRITSVSTTSPHKVQVGQDGSSITGDIVVLATHLPIMDRSMHFAILKPSRSLCIAIRVADPEAAIRMRNMSINAEKPTRYSLRVSGQEEDVIIICGEGFIQGEETETDQLYAKIEDWAREHFPVKEVITRWSSLDYKTDDHIPYIGYLHRGTNTLFTATGFSKWGLAAGFAGANVVNDLIRGIANPYHEMVDARRWDLLAQWKGLFYEQWHTTKHLLGDKIKHMISRDNIDSLKAGQGGIVRVKGEKVGAYLDENGQYHFVKPVCTHLGCDLLFNQGDKVWDCPCHGSQFAVDGSVIHGPACKPLTQLKDLEW